MTRYEDRYPFPNRSKDTVDKWGFYHVWCTSYVAWRLNDYFGTSSFGGGKFENSIGSAIKTSKGRFSDATNWRDRARDLGYEVGQEPRENAVAYWEGTAHPTLGNLGHVAFVERVYADGSFDVTEYNFENQYAFGWRRISQTSGGTYPDAFLLIKGAPPNAETSGRDTVPPSPTPPLALPPPPA